MPSRALLVAAALAAAVALVAAPVAHATPNLGTGYSMVSQSSAALPRTRYNTCLAHTNDAPCPLADLPTRVQTCSAPETLLSAQVGFENSLYVFGGGTPTKNYAQLWQYGIKDAAWTQLNPGIAPGTWSGPSPRSDLSAVVRTWSAFPVKHDLIVFGGYEQPMGGSPTNDTYEYSFKGNAWTDMTAHSPLPPPRGGHVAVYDDLRDRMIIHGGRESATGTGLNSTWTYDLKNLFWQHLSAGPLNTMSSRWGHAAAVVDNETIFAFGGMGTGGVMGDMWRYALGGDIWSQLRPPAPLPSARSGHSLVALPPVSGSTSARLLLFGGGDGTTAFGDMWVFTVQTLKWVQVTPTGPTPSPRSEHGAAMVDDQFWVFGGRGPTGSAMHDLWRFDTGSETWTQVAA